MEFQDPCRLITIPLTKHPVFLRVLEYYNGVLFLTTNRVGTIDEAFKSRIHLSLYYPPLTEKQTLDIFEVNLRRLKEIEAAKAAVLAESDPDHLEIVIDDRRIMRFARHHFRGAKNLSDRWNGRQIRNAFQVAYSLAQSRMHNADDSDHESSDDALDGAKPKVTKFTLDDEQFNTVRKSIAIFDDYLRKTRGEDSAVARNLNTREDDYIEGMGYQPPLPKISTPKRPENRRNQRNHGPDSRSRAHYQSPRRSPVGVSDLDVDDNGWALEQTRSRNRQSMSQQGGSVKSKKPSISSTHLSPASPLAKMERDHEYPNQPLSNSEDFSDEDDMSHRGSVASGTAKQRNFEYGTGERVRVRNH